MRHAGVDDLYACPLCVDLYDRGALDGILTFEHAPPRCVGGKAVALTCSPCNSFASRELDPHIERSEEYLDFAFGMTRKPLRRTWEVDGVRLHGNLRVTGDAVMFEGVAKANPPRDIETFKDLKVAEGAFTASASRGFDPQRAAIALASIRVRRVLRHVRLSVHRSGIVERGSQRICRAREFAAVSAVVD